MNPKVSVIVPVYNGEKYLCECIDSILAQTLKDIEVILVDDGSPDGCPAIIDEYAAKDSRVVAAHQENAGPGPARNKGMTLATGEFIAFMDSDDIYPSNETLEHLYNAAKTSGCKIAGGKLWLFKDGDDLKDGFELPIHTNFPYYGILDYRDFQSPYAFYCYIYNRTFVCENKLSFPPLRRFEDPVFFAKAMIAAKRFVAMNEIAYFYRVNYKTVDWLGNGARNLNDHIIGCTEVLRVANLNGLSVLAENIAKDVYGLIRPMNVSFEIFERNVTGVFLEEIKVQLNVKYLHRFQRIFGVGYRGLVERFKRFHKIVAKTERRYCL